MKILLWIGVIAVAMVAGFIFAIWLMRCAVEEVFKRRW